MQWERRARSREAKPVAHFPRPALGLNGIATAVLAPLIGKALAPDKDCLVTWRLNGWHAASHLSVFERLEFQPTSLTQLPHSILERKLVIALASTNETKRGEARSTFDTRAR